MCLLVKVSPNTDFPFAWFEDVHSSNPDGIGIMYVKDGQLYQAKSLADQPLDAFNFWKAQAPTDVEYAMHFRWKTHGAIDVARVHPYVVNDNLLIMHNGILAQKITGYDRDKDKSDTQIFAEQLGRELGEQVFTPAVARLLGEAIGSSNRFIYLSAEHGMLVVNEATGVTTERFPGCWFSNTYAWTPHQWGVPGGRGVGQGSWQSAWAQSFGLDEDDIDYVGHVALKPTTVEKRPEGWYPDKDKDAGELLDLCEDLICEARKAVRFGDMTATRFLQTFSSENDLFLHLMGLYDKPHDALGDMGSTLYCLESSQATYDDVLNWFTMPPEAEEAGTLDVSSLTAEESGDTSDDTAQRDPVVNETYSG